MKRLFGTNGVRGIVNEEMNIQFALELSKAIGTFFGGGEVVVGSDTRTSNEMIKGAVLSGLLSTGCGAVDIGIVPSPTLQLFVKEGNFKGGIIITASHNPPEYNGIKGIDHKGMELSRQEEEAIENLYFTKSFKQAKWNQIRPLRREERAIGNYLRAVLKQVDSKLIRKVKMKVVLDCGNGTACFTSPYLLRELGCEVITINGQPDGSFPGRPSEPLPENLEPLMKLVEESKADLGVAHDGDADRSIFIDEEGKYIYGDRTLALVAGSIVERQGGGLVVTPVSSSTCVEDVVKSFGGEVHYTKVGAPIVARTMFELGAVFGGEENGGLIFPNHQYCRDGGMAVAKVLEILAEKEEKMSELIGSIPEYSLFKTSVSCPEDKKEEVLEAFIDAAKDRRIITVDGAKIFYEEGWLLVRPSGTEAIFRIFAESKNSRRAEKLAKEGARKLQEIVDSFV